LHEVVGMEARVPAGRANPRQRLARRSARSPTPRPRDGGRLSL